MILLSLVNFWYCFRIPGNLVNAVFFQLSLSDLKKLNTSSKDFTPTCVTS